MKLLTLFLTASLLINAAMAQSIGIGTTTPNANAQLDIVSTTKGLLIPRMTGAQRAAIPTPLSSVGMMVIQTNTETSPPSSPGLYLLERVGVSIVWRRIARTDEITGGTSTWSINGIDQYSNVAGNVGIGTSSPIRTLHIKGDFQVDTGAVIFNTPGAILQFQNGAVNKTYLQQSGNNLRIGTSNNNEIGKIIFRMDGSDKIFIDSTGNMQITGEQDASLTTHGYLTLGSLAGNNIIIDNNEIMARNDGGADNLILQNDGGNVGIGVGSPDERLTLTGNAKLDGTQGIIKFETAVGGTGSPLVSLRYAPGLQFLRQGTTTNLAKIEYVDTADFANFLRLRVGSTVEDGITLNTSNHTGLGTNNPLARLHIKGETDLDEIAIHAGNALAGQTAAIQFYNTPLVIGAAGGPGTKKGFLMLDADDIKIGINSGNAAGKFIVRTNGGDRVFVDANGTMGVGMELVGIAEKFGVYGKSRFIANGGDAFEANGNAVIEGRLSVKNNGEVLKIDGVNPTINFLNNGTFRSFITQGNPATGHELYIAANGILHLDATTQVAIGNVVSAANNNYKLAVAGKMVCEEVKVELRTSWPDYVFDNNYKLEPLANVEKFINQNKHLPNIPSAKEVEKSGIELGEMNRKLLEKIEELTLYIIEQNKRIAALENSLPGSSKK